ncbi:hypothetical protein FXF51_43390 [Nonomuraea sp. PA05]|uniref:hypothetical protein n=1 Tax=Nonomuraea sp. PA05 TaxID=2604466 RepID=UPI0011D3A9AD|nr:hypothetical protein [Nonomuraea sp. PA05]TYB56619.1 hypothetical protein FXF51_43390 [Nonomuraea sp. PA05]
MFPRNPRHNPYAPVEPLIMWQGPGLVTRLWRWRTEIVLLTLAAGAVLAFVSAVGQGMWWATVALAGTVCVPAAVPVGRKWVRRHFWCLFSRHRIQRVCAQTSMHTRKGRIPLILWITPADFGERAFILLRAGICADDFEAFGAEIAAACCAASVRVRRHPRRAHFVTVDVVRRATDDDVPCDAGDDRLGAGTWGDGGQGGASRPLERLAG